MHDRRAQYIENHDGDSVTMLLDQDFYDFKQINIRLANTWAPELKDVGGMEVANFVRVWFKTYSVSKWGFLVFTHRTRTDRETMTLGRYVADIYTIDMTFHLNSDVMKYIADNNYTGGIGSISR
jgi:hypothetical protein